MRNDLDFIRWAKQFILITEKDIHNYRISNRSTVLYEMKREFSEKYQEKLELSYTIQTGLKHLLLTKHFNWRISNHQGYYLRSGKYCLMEDNQSDLYFSEFSEGYGLVHNMGGEGHGLSYEEEHTFHYGHSYHDGSGEIGNWKNYGYSELTGSGEGGIN